MIRFLSYLRKTMSGYFNMFKFCLAIIHQVALRACQKERIQFTIQDLLFFAVLRFAFYVFTSIRTFIVFSRLASMYLYALSY